ncbi:substrate-binding domain-containing protein [Nitratidesulfovibrio termitidis]|uniref:substrate-binding domain-containing protein n=1 Tax=Nitratidesulfovibrio termitidis TaxID=42252 RepID=UPI000428E359|nr:substrate-binding domain-containing protein [Nitratidesulfovibrio termitidis]
MQQAGAIKTAARRGLSGVLKLAAAWAVALGVAVSPATPAWAAGDSVPLTYEGASTVGGVILPEATKLFTAKSGVQFGAIGTAGAGAGFKAVVAGKVSFGGLASEPTAQEKAQLTDIVVIGYDVMGVFVHGANPIKGLSMTQLKDIFSGKATNWKDVGGADAPITVYSEKLDGGRATVKAFKSMVLGDTPYGPVKELDDATDCVADVVKDAGGITAASMSFALPGAVAVPVNGARPDAAGVRSGAYPLKRPLSLIAVNPSADVKAFFEFMLTPPAQAVVAKSFVPAK